MAPEKQTWLDAGFLQSGGEKDSPYTLEYEEAGDQFQAIGQLS
jgi:hypothetical protein